MPDYKMQSIDFDDTKIVSDAISKSNGTRVEQQIPLRLYSNRHNDNIIIHAWNDWNEQGKNCKAELIDAAVVGIAVKNPHSGHEYLKKHHPDLINSIVAKSNQELEQQILVQQTAIENLQELVARLNEELDALRLSYEENNSYMFPLVCRFESLIQAYDKRANHNLIVTSSPKELVE